MSNLAPKLKKNILTRGFVPGGRRKSSVSQVEDVVSKLMEADSGIRFFLPEIGKEEKEVKKEELIEDSKEEKDKKDVIKEAEEPSEDYKGKRRLVFIN